MEMTWKKNISWCIPEWKIFEWQSLICFRNKNTNMLSFWETESFLNYDIIIIGSGIIGLSTAISIKEKSPGKSVLVLERGLFPSGASTRNAGFASFGSLTEILSDLKHTSPETILALTEKRWRGLARL